MNSRSKHLSLALTLLCSVLFCSFLFFSFLFFIFLLLLPCLCLLSWTMEQAARLPATLEEILERGARHTFFQNHFQGGSPSRAKLSDFAIMSKAALYDTLCRMERQARGEEEPASPEEQQLAAHFFKGVYLSPSGGSSGLFPLYFVTDGGENRRQRELMALLMGDIGPFGAPHAASLLFGGSLMYRSLEIFTDLFDRLGSTPLPLGYDWFLFFLFPFLNSLSFLLSFSPSLLLSFILSFSPSFSPSLLLSFSRSSSPFLTLFLFSSDLKKKKNQSPDDKVCALSKRFQANLLGGTPGRLIQFATYVETNQVDIHFDHIV